MVQILQRDPTFGEIVGKNLGEGFSSGAKEFVKHLESRKAQMAKNAARIRPELKSFLSLYDKRKYFHSNPEELTRLEKMSHDYLGKGLEPAEAVSAAYEDIIGSEKPEDKRESSFADKHGFAPTHTFDEALEVVKGGLAKAAHIAVNAIDMPFQFARESNFLGRGKNFKTLTDYYNEATGDKGKPTNAVERIAHGIPFGLPGVIAATAEEALNSFGAPESVQRAGGIISFLASHRIKVPQLKNVIGDAKKVGEKTGQSTEQVLQKAQKESGVNLEDVAKGDQEAIGKFSKNITEQNTASKIKETPKNFFKQKTAEKERAVFGAKLPDSPIGEYYDIRARELEKQASKRPETLARDKEIKDRLAPEESRLYGELRDQTQELKKMQKALKEASPEARERITSLEGFQSKKVEKLLENLKDVQYEMKYGRPRPSEAEIDAQIEKSVAKFKEGIEKPTEKSQKDLKSQLELDKKYLDRASKLVERGELPGEIRPDTFLKMKQKYLEGYKSAIQQARNEISELKGGRDAHSLRKMENNKELIQRLSERINRLKADVVNQTDNIKAMRALEKPSGAFYKQQIRSLKKDAALFEHDLFKQKRVKGPGELKSHRTFEKAKGDIAKGKEVVEHPTKENIKEAAKEAGKGETEFTRALEKVHEEVNEIKGKVKSGTLTPNDEHKFIKNIKRYAKLGSAAFAAGIVQASLEEALGTKINAVTVKAIGRIFGVVTLGTTTTGHRVAQGFFDNLQADELRKLKGNPREWNVYLNKMEKKHGTAKVKRVLKIFNEPKS